MENHLPIKANEVSLIILVFVIEESIGSNQEREEIPPCLRGRESEPRISTG
jgi:hypothetical protein